MILPSERLIDARSYSPNLAAVFHLFFQKRSQLMGLPVAHNGSQHRWWRWLD